MSSNKDKVIIENDSNAVKLKYSLIAIILIQIAATVIGFIYVRNLLSQQEVELRQKSKDSLVVNSDSVNSEVNTILAQNAGLENKIASLYLNSADYLSSTNSIVNKYSAFANISIESVTASQEAASSSLVKAVNVNFKNPVNYSSLVKFLKYIELSNPKMQVSKLDISKPQSSSKDLVSVNSLILEVYVK